MPFSPLDATGDGRLGLWLPRIVILYSVVVLTPRIRAAETSPSKPCTKARWLRRAELWKCRAQTGNAAVKGNSGAKPSTQTPNTHRPPPTAAPCRGDYTRFLPRHPMRPPRIARDKVRVPAHSDYHVQGPRSLACPLRVDFEITSPSWSDPSVEKHLGNDQ